jgi:isocitrate/isopropylmalate dehydrogenase
MLEHLGLRQEAAAVESAVQHAVAAREGTSDIGGSLGTRETGECIARAIRSANASTTND